MAWANIVPLILLLLFAAILAAIGLVVYGIMNDVKNQTKKKMKKKNVAWTRDGVTVGVKEMKAEDYKDKTQNVLVNIWESSGIPDTSSAKIRLWGSKDGNGNGNGDKKR